MSKVTIGGVDLELNLLDADVLELFEKLNEEIIADIRNPEAYAGLSNADSMRYQCKCVNSYFDKLFGDGTSDKIFPRNNDLAVRMDAFAQVTSLSAEAKQYMDGLVAKYAPQRVQNRQDRRAAQRSKNKNHR